ncbi:lysylphosphatidylglycerol synthase domain-containing protein [Phytohabitans houttuyneae]|nr:lysylphosphatidylglycerol synthase domain-containing protein [Phytohabitans houttuyneae]
MRTVWTRVRPVVTNAWLGFAVLAASAVVSVWSIASVPQASPLPVLLGLLPWAAGKYLLCPLRWHALSMSGRSRWWHIRAYAESELIGLISPVHAGADVWRVHRLHQAGLGRTVAVAEVAMDRVLGMGGIALGVVLAGITLPWEMLAAFGTVAVVAAVVALVVHRRRPDLLARRPLPGPGVLAFGLTISVLYQVGVAGLILGSVIAVGSGVSLLGLVTVFAASQLASIIPRFGGADPHNAALAVGLASLGVPWTAALGAISLVAVVPWIPALLFGGGSFAARRVSALMAAHPNPLSAARQLIPRRVAARALAADLEPEPAALQP